MVLFYHPTLPEPLPGLFRPQYELVHIAEETRKNVSCRKQIAHQHSCQQFWPGRGRGWPFKIFLSSTFITMQYLVTVVIPKIEGAETRGDRGSCLTL